MNLPAQEAQLAQEGTRDDHLEGPLVGLGSDDRLQSPGDQESHLGQHQ
jgi:hypothetical protein